MTVPSSDVVTVRIPLSIRKRGGRKLVLAPDGTTNKWAPPRRRIDTAMVEATARAFRWREMLENGTHATSRKSPRPRRSMRPTWIAFCG